MANQRDIDRWKKGKDHWNKWAEGRLKAKKKLEKEGKWDDKKLYYLTEQAKAWIETASVDFSNHQFQEAANFKGFIFPFHTDFRMCIFQTPPVFPMLSSFLGLNFRKQDSVKR